MMPLPRHAKLVHMTFTGGHRKDYQRALSEVLGLRPSLGKVSARNFLSLVRAKALIFGSLDDDVRGFVVVATARMLIGRKTAGLFLRPHSCFSPAGFKATLKRALFHGLTRMLPVSVCTILPFEVEPRYRMVAKYGLADPQLWDRDILSISPSAEFTKHLKEWAQGRRIVAFIGTASPFKGVTQIRDMMTHHDWGDKVCVVFAGRVPEDAAYQVQEAEARGALVIPRFVSNAELESLYQVADFIWSAYEPGYDQASGNFGRAIQAGKVPVVRQGTLIERLAQLIGYPVIAIDFDEVQQGIASLQGPLPDIAGAPSEQIERWKDDFIATMGDLL